MLEEGVTDGGRSSSDRRSRLQCKETFSTKIDMLELFNEFK